MCACAVRRGWFNLQHFREMHVPLVVRSPEEGQIPRERKQKQLVTIHCKKKRNTGFAKVKRSSRTFQHHIYIKILKPKKDC